MPPKRVELAEYQKVWLAQLKQQTDFTYQQCREAFWKHFEVDPAVYKLPDGTLSAFLGKNHIAEWAGKLLHTASDKTVRDKGAKYPPLEEALHMWLIEKTEGQAGTVQEQTLVEKGREFACRMGITDLEFSRGWISRFKQRWGLKSHVRHGEAKSANLEGATL